MTLPEEEETQQQLQNPPMSLDALYCEEESFGEESYYGSIIEDESIKNCDKTVKKKPFLSSSLLQHDLVWDDSELLRLISKEKETHLCFSDVISDGSLLLARREAVEWILRVKAHYGFTALTTFLAVNYFDRFISSFKFQRDKPWMGQLAAVACLSLAAKVEETQVPLLLDLQVEESRYVFEAKTIQRMELLVLSSLQWRVNPVTPISYIDHIIRRLGLRTHLHWEFLFRCERLLLSVIADLRIMCYFPSILATATMLHVIKEVEPSGQMEYQNQLLEVLKISEDKVDECYKLIQELLGSNVSHNESRKRKHLSIPSSPNGVIDASFSCDNSNESWAVASSVSSSPERRVKRSRAQVQQMRLPSLNRMFVDVLGSPR
ncbi:Cyclin_N domain-containing protein/Cyclin_C domain-containing protein [Cephalotus follicularis]|uniref:B-like cyclin n=1 Tax=Cephalotus follicularis TaxID=3775 RepID=A0A1Q3B892_CEPFO|nr:Cyclin_N domain-containing protein/Cyclin_C domain-containing protein [Cephalotus follicularis]